MKITSGLALIAAALTATACGTTAGHDNASAPNAVISSFLQTASPGGTASVCQAQVAAWTGGAERTINQIADELVKLDGTGMTAVSADQFVPYAGPFGNLAGRASAEPPPTCSASLSRHWGTLVSNLSALSAQLGLGDKGDFGLYAKNTVSALARLIIDLHMTLKPLVSVTIPALSPS